MKSLLQLLFSVAIFFAVSARCQQTQVSSQATASAFQAQVQKELSRFQYGAELYRTCDVFSRKINDAATRALGISSAPLSEQKDTSETGDISRTPTEEDEPSIAINRRNPQLIIAGANDMAMTTLSMPAYVSTNAGVSWKTYRLPVIDDKGAGAYGDPMLICDDSGTFYYSFLVDNPLFNGVSDLMVSHSTDGIHWILGSPVLGNADSTRLEDKETIAVDNDPASPYHGRLYIAWTEYDMSSRSALGHYLAFSDDKGETWSPPQPYTETYGYFALLRIGKGGTVFIASSNIDQQSGSYAHGMVVSGDGGLSFLENPISDFTDYPVVNSGDNGLKGNGFRAFPYVSYDVDPASNTLYAVFGSYDNNNGDAMEFEITSSDLGQDWSTPQQIGTPTLLGNDHFMPWVSFDPVLHRAYISMYSSEEDTILNLKSRAVRCEFSAPNQMEDIGRDLFNPLLNTSGGWNFIGDYTGNDSYGGTFAAAWTENRQPSFHDGDIFAYVSAPLAGVDGGQTQPINGHDFTVGNFSPNPVSGNSVSLSISSNEDRTVVARIFDLKGSRVLTHSATIAPSDANEISLDIHSLPAGVYHVVISSGANIEDRNLVVLR